MGVPLPDFGLLPPPGGVTSWTQDEFSFEIDQGVAALDPGSCAPRGAVHLAADDREFQVRAPAKYAAVRAHGVGAPPLVEVFASGGDGDPRLAAKHRAERQGDGWIALVWAEGIAGCRISGDDLRICEISFGLPDEWSAWQKLNDEPILLPVVDHGTTNEPANLHEAEATRAEAYRRLSDTLDGDRRKALASALAGEPAELLESLVRDGRDAVLPSAPTETTTVRTPPQVGMSAGQLAALIALDPDVSRMLGLYWHDPVDGGTWDYKVVAHFGSVRYPSRVLTFGDRPAGDVDAATLGLDGASFVGNAGLEVLPADHGGTEARLRVSQPVIGTAAGILLEPPRPAITISVDGNPVTQFAAWRGAKQVATALSFILGKVTLEDAGGIDAVTWSVGPIDLVSVELFAEAGLVGDLEAFAWRLSPDAPPPVRDLVLTDAGAAADPPRVLADGTVEPAGGIVGLDWGETSAIVDVSRPVRALVGRASPSADGSRRAPSAIEVRNAEHPAAAFAETPGGTPWPGPDMPHRWLERGLPAGSYAWSVRGVDAFGRLGDWSEPRVTNVPAGSAPPPPDAVGAAYLDPDDPLLSDEQRALVDRDGAGLLVWWSWPARHRIAAPGVEPDGEFRVYVNRGDPNRIAGSVLTVTDLGDHSRLDTDCDLPGAADALTGELLRVGGVSFGIVGNTQGADASIEVANRTAPTARPTAGQFSIRLSEGSALYDDLGVSGSWDERVHVQPVGDLPRLTTTVSAVTGDGSLTLGQAMPTLPPGTLPGVLVAGGVAFPVRAQNSGSHEVDVDPPVQVDESALLPTAGDPCSVWTGLRYEAWLPGVDLRPGPAEPLGLTLVGVSTCDVDAVILHEPLPPHHRALRGVDASPGLEGPVSRVARVSVPHRGAPTAVEVTRPPEQDRDIPADHARPADWYGRARYDLAFPTVAGATGYRVLRASVAALAERDRSQRQARADPYTAEPFVDQGASESWLAEHYPTLTVDDLTGTSADAATVQAAWRDWSAWYYPQQLNRTLMDLAELPCNEAAFAPAHEGTIAGPPFADTIDGRGLGRFVYRVRSIDASGNVSGPSPAFPLVEVADVTPPAAPSVTSTLGGESSAVLGWRANREPDLATYRVWRAASTAELADVRRLEPHADLAPTAGAVTETWTDAGLAARVDWYYRLAAVDAAGNVSAPSAIVRARPVDTIPPNPTTWVSAAWTWLDEAAGRRGVSLVWEGDETGLSCLLERRRDGARTWTPLTDWIEPDGADGDGQRFAYVDEQADPAAGWRYRARVRDAAGNVSSGMVEVLVRVPEDES